jgi:hypothetical protein
MQGLITKISLSNSTLHRLLSVRVRKLASSAPINFPLCQGNAVSCHYFDQINSRCCCTQSEATYSMLHIYTCICGCSYILYVAICRSCSGSTHKPIQFCHAQIALPLTVHKQWMCLSPSAIYCYQENKKKFVFKWMWFTHLNLNT